MKRFYKINDFMFMEIGFTDKWYAELIDIKKHKIISTFSNADKFNLIAEIVRDYWFGSNSDNFTIFIKDMYLLDI